MSASADPTELGDFSMATASNTAELQRSIRGIVRADHPMVPRSDGVYYFEVTLEWAIGSGYVHNLFVPKL